MKKNILPVILGICNAVLLVVILISVFTGWRTYGTAEPEPSQEMRDATQPYFPTADVPPAKPAPPMTEAATEAPTEVPALPPTEAPTEAPLPYMEELGAPSAEDFVWLFDVANGELHPNLSYLDKDDILGRWKAEIVFDNIWQLAYVTISPDGTVTLQPYSIYRGNGWEDQRGDSPMVFRGQFDISRIFGEGESGSIDLHTLYESGGVQYGFGSFEAMSGDVGMIGLVRP